MRRFISCVGLVALFGCLFQPQCLGQTTAGDPLSKAQALITQSKPLALSILVVAPLKKEPKNLLAGRKGKGSINSRTIFMEFGADGETVSASTQGSMTTEKPFTGKYTMSGDFVDFVLGPSTFTGILKGNEIIGVRKRTDGIRDGWELTLER